MSVKWKADNKNKAQEWGVNLTNWRSYGDGSNIHGDLPELPRKLGANKTNQELAKEYSDKLGGVVTTRQISKWRNHRIPEPKVKSIL